VTYYAQACFGKRRLKRRHIKPINGCCRTFHRQVNKVEAVSRRPACFSNRILSGVIHHANLHRPSCKNRESRTETEMIFCCALLWQPCLRYHDTDSQARVVVLINDSETARQKQKSPRPQKGREA
jgi:hypothetical protein